MNKYKKYIGYEYLDNIFTGLFIGLIGIGLMFYAQLRFYSVINIWSHHDLFTIPFLKRSLLAAIPIFFIFSHFEKLYSARGVVFSIIILGAYLVKLMFF